LGHDSPCVSSGRDRRAARSGGSLEVPWAFGLRRHIGHATFPEPRTWLLKAGQRREWNSMLVRESAVPCQADCMGKHCALRDRCLELTRLGTLEIEREPSQDQRRTFAGGTRTRALLHVAAASPRHLLRPAGGMHPWFSPHTRLWWVVHAK